MSSEAVNLLRKVLKPSQGLIIKSPSNGGELIKLWQHRTLLCYRVMTVKPDAPDMYDQSELVEVPLDSVGAVSAFGESAPFSVTIAHDKGALVLEPSTFEEMSLLTVGFTGLRDQPTPEVVGGAPGEAEDDTDAAKDTDKLLVMLPPPTHPARLACWKVVTNPYFDYVILAAISTNCFLMAVEDPTTTDDDGPASDGKIMYFDFTYQTAADISRSLLFLFTIESILKNLSYTPWGYFFGPDANWNRLDFFIVTVGWLEAYPDYLGALPINLTFLRIFRVFRPLRTLGKMDGMKELINTLFLCVDPLVDVMNLTIFVFFVFSVLGMELFQGQGSQRCLDLSNWDEKTQTGSWTVLPDDAKPVENIEERRCGGEFQCPTDWNGVKYTCANAGRNPAEGIYQQNSANGVIGYDNLGQAMLTVFVFCTGEGWSDGMYQFQDSFSWSVSSIYHCFMMMMGNMFCFNLALAVIADTFEAESENDKAEEAAEEEAAAKAAIAAGEDPAKDDASEGSAKDDPRGPRPENRVRGLLYDLSYSPNFGYAVVVLILLNTVTLAMEHSVTECLPLVDVWPLGDARYGGYTGTKPDCIVQANTMDDELQNMLFFTNLFFVYSFASEAVIKLIGLGPTWYFKDNFNCFDFIIVLVSFIEMSFNLKGMTALRCFRLARLFKMARSWGSLRAIIESLLEVMPAMMSMFIMLGLYMFIATVAGMQLLGSSIPYTSRSRFTDFGIALLTVFQMLTGENWNEVLFESVATTGSYSCVVYFIFVMLTGQFLVLNLFLAIMLSDFNCGEPPDFSITNMINTIVHLFKKPSDGTTDDVDAAMEAGEGKTGDEAAFFTPAQLARMADKSSNSDDDIRKNREKIRSKSATRKEEMAKEGKHGSMEMVAIQDDLQRTKREEDATIRATLKGKSLGLFDIDNKFRIACMAICRNPTFEAFILVCIVMSSVILAVDGPTTDNSSTGWVLVSFLDFAFILIFTVEMLLKIVTLGFYWCPEGYLTDPWNTLDFVVVIVAWVSSNYDFMPMPWGSAGASISAFRTLRSLRALRPLRTIQRLPGMRLVVAVLFECTPVFFNICLVVLFFFIVFAIMGAQFFKGQFWSCNDFAVDRVDQCWGCFYDPGGENCAAGTGANGVNCVQSKYCPEDYSLRKWRNAKMNFDNVWNALNTLYSVGSTEMWLDVLHAVMDTRPGYSRDAHGDPEFPYGYQPQQERNPMAALFLVVFMLFGVFIVLNLFVGAVVDKFNELKDSNGGKSPLQTEEQSQYTESMQLMARMRPFKVPLPPRKPLKKAVAKAFQDWVYVARLQCYKIVMWDTSGKSMGTTFDMVISTCVMVNILVMGMYYWKRIPDGGAYAVGQPGIFAYQESDYYNALETLNNVFTLIFFIEMNLKLMAWGFTQYIVDMWNQLDCVLVVSSCLGWVVEFMLTSGDFPLNPAVFRILRVARMTRALKSIRMVGRIKGLARLFDTLILALPAMANVASLCFLVMFIFTVLGMDFFGNDDLEKTYTYGMYNAYANFRYFGDGFLFLFRATTGESWDGFMLDVMVAKCDMKLNEDDLGVDGDPSYCNVTPTGRKSAWIFFVLFSIFVSGLLFELITAIVLDTFGKMNEAEKLPVNGDMIANFNDHWAQLDPKATQLIPQFKLLPFLKSINPPIFENAHEASTEIFKMSIAASEGPKGSAKGVLYVHYVDTLVAVVRYLYVKKLGDDVGADLDVTMIESPELTTRIVNAYPHLNKISKMEPKDFKTELAATKMQNLWLRKHASKKIKAVRETFEVELSTRRGTKGGKVDPAVSALPAAELMAALREGGGTPRITIK